MSRSIHTGANHPNATRFPIPENEEVVFEEDGFRYRIAFVRQDDQGIRIVCDSAVAIEPIASNTFIVKAAR